MISWNFNRYNLFIPFIGFVSHALLEMIADLQSERMDEQRAQLPGLVTRRNGSSPGGPSTSNVSNQSKSKKSLPAPDDAFLDMLIRCQVNHISLLSSPSCRYRCYRFFLVST